MRLFPLGICLALAFILGLPAFSQYEWERFSSPELDRLHAEIFERYGVRIEASRWLCHGEAHGSMNNAEFGVGWSAASITSTHETLLKNFLREADRAGLPKVALPANAFFTVSYAPPVTSCELLGVLVLPIASAYRAFSGKPSLKVNFGTAPNFPRFDPTYVMDERLPILGLKSNASARVSAEYPGMGAVLTSYSESIAKLYVEEFQKYPAAGSREAKEMDALAELIAEEMSKLGEMGVVACYTLNAEDCRRGDVSNAKAVPFADRTGMLLKLTQLRRSLEASSRVSPLQAQDSRLKIQQLPERVEDDTWAEVHRMLGEKGIARVLTGR